MSRGGGRRGRLVVRAAVLAFLVGTSGACRDADCIDTSMRAEPATVTSAADAVLRVRVTADGRPVSDTPVSFSARTPDGKSALLDVGATDTNADGVGEYRLANELLSTYQRELLQSVREYEATSGHRLGGRYCRASAKAPFSFRMGVTP